MRKTVDQYLLKFSGLVIGVGAMLIVSAAQAEETLSPAETALQSQLTSEAEKIARAQKICEQIILSGIEPAKTQLIQSLNGKTCAEAAQEASVAQ